MSYCRSVQVTADSCYLTWRLGMPPRSPGPGGVGEEGVMPKKRAHSGHVNRGLPPTALYELYEKTPGDHLDRLLALGIVKPGPEFTPVQNVHALAATTDAADSKRGRVTLAK